MSFFEKITDGLKSYEVVMMCFGSLMFVVILGLLVFFAVSKRPLKQLLVYFGIAVLMLGWPSVQKIKIGETGVELEKTTKQYAEKPTPENKKKVTDLIDELKDRNVKDPDVVKKIARAEFMIGKSQESLQTIGTLPAKERQDSSINQLRAHIQLNDSVNALLHVVQSGDPDSSEITKLNELLSRAVNLAIRNPQLDSSIRVADQEIAKYKRRHPNVKMK
jgi:hypothetical protein